MKKLNLLIALAFCCLKLTYSQPAKLDSTFGGNGIVKTDFGDKVPTGSAITNVLLQADNSSFVTFETYYQNFLVKIFPNGTLDSSYGIKGFCTLYFNPSNVVQQPDGKLVLAGSGSNNFAVSRINKDGSPDSTFSHDGLQITTFNYPDVPYVLTSKVAVQSDGKIVVLGFAYQNFLLVRYNVDGSVDSSFADNGKLLTDMVGDGGAIAIENDGKIVIAGGFQTSSNTPDFMVARFNTDGSTDSTFSEDGKQTTDFNSWLETATSITIENDRKILVVGTVGLNFNDFALARYNLDGSPDNNFGKGGKLVTHLPGFENDEASSIAIQDDGKIILAGFAEKEGRLSDFAIVRYNTNGSLDKSFSDDGWQTTDFDSLNNSANSIVMQGDGKIVVAGGSGTPGQSTSDRYCVARYNANGSLDNTFNDNGKSTYSLIFKEANTQYTTAAIQKDGKIIAGGHTQKGIYEQEHFLIRYNTDGSIDSSFANNGRKTIGSDIVAIAIQNDDKILVEFGNFDTGPTYKLSRYNTDGSLDKSFASSGTLSQRLDIATSLAIQKDGKIVVAGIATEDNNPTVFRYTIDGAIDSTFSNDGEQPVNFGTYTGIDAIAIQDDGKIVAGDSYGSGDIRLARLNSDGSIDNSFGTQGTQTTLGSDDVTSIAFENDGKIVVGAFNHNENLSTFIGVYNSDGSPDTNFSGTGKLIRDFGSGTANFQSVEVQNDGKILVCSLAGSFSNLTGNISVISRYNRNGSLDSSFGNNGEIYPNNFNPKNIILYGNKLYGVGSGYNGPFAGGVFGAVGRYVLSDTSETPPTVTITTPADNGTYLAPAEGIKLSATASDDGIITKVEFYNGTNLLHTETVVPYGFVWRNVPLGNYTLTAKAYDNSGSVTTSAPVHISVVPNKAPTVSVIKPKNNQPFAAPGYIHFEADAKDVDGRITRVEFYNGSNLLNTQYQFPYTFVWRDLPIGTYTITAVVTDNWGAHTTSVPITFRVISADTKIVSNKPSSGDKTAINNAAGLSVAPNPAANIINIYTAGLQQNEAATILVISSSGAVMKTIRANSSTKVIELNVSSLLGGVYTIKLISADKVLYKQFVKK